MSATIHIKGAILNDPECAGRGPGCGHVYFDIVDSGLVRRFRSADISVSNGMSSWGDAAIKPVYPEDALEPIVASLRAYLSNHCAEWLLSVRDQRERRCTAQARGALSSSRASL